jgi:hypothetical protein
MKLGQHQYHPLLVFDGESSQFVTAVLRPGNAHVSTVSELLVGAEESAEL